MLFIICGIFIGTVAGTVMRGDPRFRIKHFLALVVLIATITYFVDRPILTFTKVAELYVSLALSAILARGSMIRRVRRRPITTKNSDSVQ